MCCGSGTSEKQKIPEWLEKSAKGTLGRVESFSKTPYQTYSGDRQAGFSGDQTSAFQQLRDYVGGGGTSGLADEGTGMIRSGAQAPGSQVSTERVVDENGRLGSIGDYFNQFTNATLQPGLREIEEGAALGRNRLGSMATSAGAFGDARHGILEQGLDQDRLQARGDLTANAFRDAWDSAMGLRSGDLDRFTNTDTTNATLNETALNRLMEGGGALTGQASTQQNDLLSRLSALLSTGTTQQQQEQSGLDVGYQDFLAKQQDPYDKLGLLISALGQTPAKANITTSTDDGGAGLLGSLGSLVGAFI